MINFFGKGYGKLDDKGRIVLPAIFKSALRGEAQEGETPDMRLVIKKDIYSPCLEVYAYSEWEQQANAIRNSLDIVFNRAHAAFWRRYMSDCTVVTPDEKFGRLSIPEELLGSIGINQENREAVFAGVGYKIELWSKKDREENLISTEEYERIAEELSQQR